MQTPVNKPMEGYKDILIYSPEAFQSEKEEENE